MSEAHNENNGSSEPWDLLVVGSGVAGLAAAVSYLEACQGMQGPPRRVAVLERGTEEEQPGNSRWTGAFLRMKDTRTVAEGFVEDLAAFAEGGLDSAPARHIPNMRSHYEKLAALAPETLSWLEGHGVEFESNERSYISPSPLSLKPVGEGSEVVRRLIIALRELGGEMMYAMTARSLIENESGEVSGVTVRDRAGHSQRLYARSVVLASGGFGGNPEMMTRYVGGHAARLNTIAPGGAFNKGDGIRMAHEVGAEMSGQWDMFHGEPSDPRSKRPDVVNTLYPFGLLVDTSGSRFIDEGSGIFQDTFENISFEIFKRPGQIAWLIADSQIEENEDIVRFSRGMFTLEAPYKANSLTELASRIDLPVEELVKTVSAYNDACPRDVSGFDPTRTDGLATEGLTPAKSNWARPIERGPYLAWPIVCATCFTFGGILTNDYSEVIATDGGPIRGLYAAGEVSGVFYNTYAGGVSVLRGLVFGRVAGQRVASLEPTVA